MSINKIYRGRGQSGTPEEVGNTGGGTPTPAEKQTASIEFAGGTTAVSVDNTTTTRQLAILADTDADPEDWVVDVSDPRICTAVLNATGTQLTVTGLHPKATAVTVTIVVPATDNYKPTSTTLDVTSDVRDSAILYAPGGSYNSAWNFKKNSTISGPVAEFTANGIHLKTIGKHAVGTYDGDANYKTALSDKSGYHIEVTLRDVSWSGTSTTSAGCYICAADSSDSLYSGGATILVTDTNITTAKVMTLDSWPVAKNGKYLQILAYGVTGSGATSGTQAISEFTISKVEMIENDLTDE